MFARERLACELALWRRAGRRPQFWWRDDDAQRLTPALARLLDLAERAEAPLALAVTPIGADPDLAAFLRRRPRVAVLQFGVDRHNAGSPDRPSQFDEATPVEAVAAAIHRGWTALKPFEMALPVYASPWNRWQPNVRAALEWMSMAGLSGFGAEASSAPPIRVDVHLDLLDGRQGRPALDPERSLGRLAALLSQRRRSTRWCEPIGLLTRHLDQNEPAWTFLAALLAWPVLRDQMRWRSAQDLFMGSPPFVVLNDQPGHGVGAPVRPIRSQGAFA
jgi:hypothetical protein